MNLTFSSVFSFYVAVSLAFILYSWFKFIWRRRHELDGERRIFICGFCRTKVPEEDKGRRLRCPACGAVQEKVKLEANGDSIYGNVDWKKS